MNKNQITLLLLCIVVFLSTIFVGCKKNLEPVPEITPNTKSSPYDHNIRELAEMHNKAFQELLKAYDYQAEDWQQAFIASINSISLIDEKEKEMLIEEFVNNGWLTMNSCDEYVERIVNDAFEAIGNYNFEHHDIVMKYVNQCIDLTKNIKNYDQFVKEEDNIVEYARHELNDEELIAVQSVAYVFESTSYLWLPQEMGGSGLALSFILSINPDFKYETLTKDIPTWLRNGLIADGVTAVVKLPQIIAAVAAGGAAGVVAVAVRIGASSVAAALYTAVKVQPKSKNLPDEEMQKMGMYHNEAVLQLIENFNTSTDNLQEEMNRCISIMDGLTDEEKKQLIDELNNEKWWEQNPYKSTEILINNFYESIVNSQFEKKDALLKYAKDCVDNANDISNLASYVYDNNKLLEAASEELGEGTELDILKSLVYVANSSAELWLPESFGGTGVFGDFINSFDPDMNIVQNRDVPRWVKNGILRDAITAASIFSFCWWTITSPQALLGVAVASGISSAIAAAQTYLEDKNPKPKKQ